MKKKKTITTHYQLELKDEIKNNKAFTRGLRKKINHKNKDQIENINT
jgi:hypothetical protein